MNTKQPSIRFPLNLLAAAIVSSTLPSQVYAADDLLVSTMIVTASRDDESTQKLPVSVSTVEEKQLELDQGSHIQDSTRVMAGVTINQLTGSSSHNTGIRMPLNYSGYYLFLQDSIPLQSSAFFNHNGLRWSSFNTSAEQIEVLKGAGTTLYGSGAVAATINVLSAEPSFSPKGDVRVLGGNDDYVQIKAKHSDKIADDQAILISASALQDKGWRDHTARERQEVLMKHLWEIDADTELKTQFQASTMTDEMATSLSKEQYETDPSQSGLNPLVQDINPERDSDFLRLSFELNHQMSDQLSLSLIPYIRHNTNDYIATWRSYTPWNESSVDTYGLLAKGDWLHDNGSETIWGLDLEHSKSDILSIQPLTITLPSWGGGSTTYTEGFKYRDQEISYSSASPYIQHNFMLGQRWSLQAGARYDYSRFELDNHLAETDNDGFGNRQLADRKDSFNSFNPKLGFHYALTDNSGFFGRLAQANRLPTASTLYNLDSGDSGSLVGGVSEEQSTTAELGYRLHKQNLTLSMAVYRMDIDDAIVTATDNLGDTYRTNAGETRHEGIELEIAYQFNPGLTGQLAYSYSRHEFIDYTNDGIDYSGNTMKFAPKNKAGAMLSWSPQSLSGLDLQLQMDHFGKYWKDDANSEKAKSYTLFHLKGQYKVTPDMTLFARVDNLLDKDYVSQSEISWGRDKYYPGSARNLKAGIKLSW